MMALPPTETSERDINQGPFLNAASRLSIEETQAFKSLKLRLRSFKFRYENFATIPGLTLIGSCLLHHSNIILKSNVKHTGAVWHTLKQQVGNGFKLSYVLSFQIVSAGHGLAHGSDRASMSSVLASPKYFLLLIN